MDQAPITKRNLRLKMSAKRTVGGVMMPEYPTALNRADAETQLATAENDRVTALFDYFNARIEFAQAMGRITQLSL